MLIPSGLVHVQEIPGDWAHDVDVSLFQVIAVVFFEEGTFLARR